MIEYLKICRIEHWLKNIFIVFGHAVALVLVLNMEIDGAFIKNAALSLLPVCLLASAYYILNEILDAPYDAQHPTKKLRGIPAGKVKISILWPLMGALLVCAFALSWFLFPNRNYIICMAILFGSALLYNVPPIRLKDKAFLDVITESFNNPLRLFLGWFAVLPSYSGWPPISITLAWWFFGALLMTGKRYTEYRFLGDDDANRGFYRKSFKTYTESRLVLAMISYACLFCFCTGIAMATYELLHNLVLIFPLVVAAIIAYFHHAIKEENAKLEPEKLLQSPPLLIALVITCALSVWLLFAGKNGSFDVIEGMGLMQPKWEENVSHEG